VKNADGVGFKTYFYLDWVVSQNLFSLIGCKIFMIAHEK